MSIPSALPFRAGLVFRIVWDRSVVPHLPLWARPLAPLVYAVVVVRGLEELYRAVVKARPTQTGTP